jgi:hypothetical protein
MPSNYNGNSAASQSPSPPPGSSYNTVVSLPSDGDPDNAAAYAQGYKVLADRAAFQQKSSNAFLPQIASGGVGYTVVSHTGGGTGTVTPSGVVSVTGGVYFAIKIIVGGAVATATFQSSLDGGVTYGATQTTAASMTDATTGVTLAFAGTFNATDVYQWTSALTPQAQWKDGSGNVRSLIDHNGYRGGRLCELRENWISENTAISSSITPIAKLPRWSALIASGGTITPGSGGTTSAYPAPAISVATSATNGSKSSLYSAGPLVRIAGAASFILEFDLGLNATGTYTVWAGLDSTNDPQAGTTHGVRIRAQSGTANWQVDFIEAGTTTIDSGVAVNAAATDASSLTAKIELHGSSSPFGKTAWVFLNGILVAESTNVPVGNSLNAVFEVFAGASTSASTLALGTVTSTVNRALAPVAV